MHKKLGWLVLRRFMCRNGDSVQPWEADDFRQGGVAVRNETEWSSRERYHFVPSIPFTQGKGKKSRHMQPLCIRVEPVTGRAT